MKGVEPGEDQLVVHFDSDEAGLLAGMIDQLVELLTDSDLATPATAAPEKPDADPFARWEAEFSQHPGPTVDDFDEGDDFDPVIARLFPNACPDDPAVSHDFRRFTQGQQRAEKVSDARLVVADLLRTDRRGRCRVPSSHTTAWLKTLTNVRLSLAARLDITDEVSADQASQYPEGDPRAWMYEVYAWTGWLQECVIEAL